jgi:hypothetical protein
MAAEEIIFNWMNGKSYANPATTDTTAIIRHHYAPIIAELEAENGRLREANDCLRGLLREWRTTPFFADPKGFQKWSAEFGAVVDTALAQEGEGK